ncbi:MAG: hypothetical protein ACYDCM_15185 [Candidatus Acidiferrales bacterium]
MDTKNAFYGALCGVLVFSALNWMQLRQSARAAAPVSPQAQEGRFEAVQLHAGAEVGWSGILDTETGCTWIYRIPPQLTHSNPPKSLWAASVLVEGPAVFQTIPFDADYLSPTIPDLENPTPPSAAEINRILLADDAKRVQEMEKATTLCGKIRVQALEAATAHQTVQ